MAFNTVITGVTGITAEALQITGSTFTPVLNRLYRITYYEPNVTTSVTGSLVLKIRLTNISGAIQNQIVLDCGSTGVGTGGSCVAVKSFASTTPTNVVGTLFNFAGSGAAARSSTNIAFLLVEDIGPV